MSLFSMVVGLISDKCPLSRSCMCNDGDPHTLHAKYQSCEIDSVAFSCQNQHQNFQCSLWLSCEQG